MLGLDHARAFREEPIPFALRLHKEFGDVVYMKIGPVDWFMLNHPDFVKEVLVTRAKEFGKSEQFKRILRSVDGNGLVVSEGEFWLKQRRTIQPTFAHDKISHYAEVITAKVNAHIAGWKPGAELNIADEMTNLTLKIAARIFLGVDVEGRETELANAVTTVSKAMYREFTGVLPVPDWVPIPSKIEKQQAIATLDRLCEEGVRTQRAKPSSDTMLSLLVRARDTEGSGEEMPHEQIISEAKTMFNAGHDSTAAGLSWAWYLLIQNQQSYEHLCKEGSEFATLVAKEALRLYPPAWLIPRQAMHDTELGGYSIPKGSYVNLFAFVIQRDPRFFDEPEKFIPDRFSPNHGTEHHPFAWFPFGAGPRTCIGRDFALMEMQIILTLISQKFRFELAPGQGEVQMNPLISLEPKDGIRVIAIPR